jgi:GTP-binding protein LepA
VGGYCAVLKNEMPRQMFKIPIQACVGVKVTASESILPVQKDLLAKCYGGDSTRKKKLLQKEAKGKARMKRGGFVFCLRLAARTATDRKELSQSNRHRL